MSIMLGVNFIFSQQNKLFMETQTAHEQEASMRKDVYALVNEKIIAQLDKGMVPWRKPWTNGGQPQNFITKRPYHGINLVLLAMAGFEHNQFLTFNQLKQIGGKVKKGEKGHLIVFWEPAKQQPGEAAAQTEAPAEEKKKGILQYYYVFNIAQCENIPEKYLPAAREAVELPSCEATISAMPQCPQIRHKEQSAFYDPKNDYVNMPKKRSFKSDASYYSTLFHELVHSTGHESRLSRATLTQMAEFGSEPYSQEELVAEMGTCYLQSHAGITEEFESSAAYIQGWLSKLKNDRLFIFQAASAAQKAVNFILNLKPEHTEKGE